jgi:hypothetical protein
MSAISRGPFAQLPSISSDANESDEVFLIKPSSPLVLVSYLIQIGPSGSRTYPGGAPDKICGLLSSPYYNSGDVPCGVR